MKKLNVFKLVTVLFVFVLIIQFSSPAFALSELYEGAREITDIYNDEFGNGYIYYFRVEKYAGIDERIGTAAIGSKTYHTQGTATYFNAGYYEMFFPSSFSMADPTDVRAMAESIGVKTQYLVNAYSNMVVVPAASCSGYYTLRTDLWGYNGEYETNIDYGDGCILGHQFEVYTFAVQASSGINGYLYCP